MEASWYWHKGTYRPMEQNRKSENKPSHMRVSDFRQGCQDHSMGKRVFSTNSAGKTGYAGAKKKKMKLDPSCM